MFNIIPKSFYNLIPNDWVFHIFTGPLKGYKWISGAASGYGKGLSILINKSEPEQMELVKNAITKNDICMDIGANVGIYTLMFSKYAKFVYSVEPLHRNLFYLYKHIQINKIRNVSILSFAFYSKPTLSSFHDEGQYSEGKLSENGNVITITTTIDDFVTKFDVKPQIIKIDVEGAEFEVLKGGKKYLSENKPIKIFLSTHSQELKNNCLSLLADFGFKDIKPINNTKINLASEFLISNL